MSDWETVISLLLGKWFWYFILEIKSYTRNSKIMSESCLWPQVIFAPTLISFDSYLSCGTNGTCCLSLASFLQYSRMHAFIHSTDILPHLSATKLHSRHWTYNNGIELPSLQYFRSTFCLLWVGFCNIVEISNLPIIAYYLKAKPVEDCGQGYLSIVFPLNREHQKKGKEW